MKICVVTSYAAAAEPRAPKHAVAARKAFPRAEIVFVDFAAAGTLKAPDPPVLQEHEIKRHTIEFPTRKSNLAALVMRKTRTHLIGSAMSYCGKDHESVFGDRIQGLTSVLSRIGADAYIAHNIETLLPSIAAAKTNRARVVFDCMEYYSDMGEGQSRTQSKAASRLQARYLPSCALVIASSDCMADALAKEYRIARPLPVYNTPNITGRLPQRRGGGLNLYWRNSVIGFGQRGLEDAILALSYLPKNVNLFVQGRPPADKGTHMSALVARLGLGERLVVLPPYVQDQAVEQAAPYDIGLCLERKGPRNHELTVSNKMFDYHMAGLAVIAADLRGLRDVILRSGGGLLYEPGNPRSLAAAINRLHSSSALRMELQQSARRFALQAANLNIELEKTADALQIALQTTSKSVLNEHYAST